MTYLLVGLFVALLAIPVWQEWARRRFARRWAAAQGLAIDSFRSANLGEHPDAFKLTTRQRVAYRIVARDAAGNRLTGLVLLHTRFLEFAGHEVEFMWDDRPTGAPGFPVIAASQPRSPDAEE